MAVKKQDILAALFGSNSNRELLEFAKFLNDMKKILEFFLSLVGLGHTTVTPRVPMGMVSIPVALSVTTPISTEESVFIPIRNLTCVSAGKKKVRFVTRRGHWMAGEIIEHNGDGEIRLRRPGHRFGPVFRGVLTE